MLSPHILQIFITCAYKLGQHQRDGLPRMQKKTVHTKVEPEIWYIMV